MTIKNRITKLEEASPPDKARMRRAISYHILETMPMSDRERVCRRILACARSGLSFRLDPVVAAFFAKRERLLSEHLKR